MNPDLYLLGIPHSFPYTLRRAPSNPEKKTFYSNWNTTQKYKTKILN